MSFPNVAGPCRRVFVCGHFDDRFFSGFPFSEMLLQEWNAPATACSSTTALAELAGDARLVYAEVIENFPL